MGTETIYVMEQVLDQPVFNVKPVDSTDDTSLGYVVPNTID